MRHGQYAIIVVNSITYDKKIPKHYKAFLNMPGPTARMDLYPESLQLTSRIIYSAIGNRTATQQLNRLTASGIGKD